MSENKIIYVDRRVTQILVKVTFTIFKRIVS